MRHPLSLLRRWFALLLILILSGCAAATAPLPTATPTASPNPLAGTDWRLLEINSQPVLADFPIYLHFWRESLNGEMGCNNYQARYTLDGQQIRLREISVTVQLCEPPALMEQEARYIDAWKEHALQAPLPFRLRQEGSMAYLEFVDSGGNVVLLFENAVRAGR